MEINISVEKRSVLCLHIQEVNTGGLLERLELIRFWQENDVNSIGVLMKRRDWRQGVNIINGYRKIKTFLSFRMGDEMLRRKI